jgi:YgiT-type zinc finger domain-containing protein
MHEYDDCSLCGGEVKEANVELDYRHKGKLFIFQNVPVGVCQQCAEKYLTAEIAKKIERRILSNNTWDRTISVPVEDFTEAWTFA